MKEHLKVYTCHTKLYAAEFVKRLKCCFKRKNTFTCSRWMLATCNIISLFHVSFEGHKMPIVSGRWSHICTKMWPYLLVKHIRNVHSHLCIRFRKQLEKEREENVYNNLNYLPKSRNLKCLNCPAKAHSHV